MLAGARSFTAIAEWATDADEETLARLGVTGKVPAESTIRRVLQRLDVDAFDKLAGRGRLSAPRLWRAGAGLSRWTARPYAAPAAAARMPRTCSLRSITRTARCWATAAGPASGPACATS
jgi:hypothetical protein